MSWVSEGSQLTPDAAPAWLKPLVDNVGHVRRAARRQLPADVLVMVSAADAKAALTGAGRDAAVLVLRPGHTRIADLDATLGVLGRAGRRPEGLLVIGGGGPAPTAAAPRAGGVPAGAVGGAPVTRTAGA